PEPSGAGSSDVSQPRAVTRSAPCSSSGSGGARTTASLPSTCVWACNVSHVARHASYGSDGHRELNASAYAQRERGRSPPRHDFGTGLKVGRAARSPKKPGMTSRAELHAPAVLPLDSAERLSHRGV